MNGGHGELLEGEIDRAPVEPVGAEVFAIGDAIQCVPHLGLFILRSAHVVLEPAAPNIGNERQVVERSKRCALLQPPPVVVGTAAVLGRAGVLAADAAQLLGWRRRLRRPVRGRSLTQHLFALPRLVHGI